MSPPRYDAVLSDLDGVLVDSGAAVGRAWTAWARRRGVDPAALDGLVHGVPSVRVIATVAPGLDVAAEAAWVERAQVDDVDGVVALPGAAELLAGAAGVPLAVVTSCTDALAAARLRAAGLPTPEVLVTADRVTAGKPDPEGYLRAAAALGIDPARAIVLEDAPAGIAAGRAAGATVVGITTTHEPAELRQADHLAASVADALARYRPSSDE
jgi:mannitol-1-/sugar-/sorbitol-6-phosphatase